MRKLSMIALVISLVSLATTTFAQEQKQEKAAPAKESAPAKAESITCCEGMEKMGEIKADMPMKADMKAKMQAMKQKMTEKTAEKENRPQTIASKVEETQPTKDAHKH